MELDTDIMNGVGPLVDEAPVGQEPTPARAQSATVEGESPAEEFNRTTSVSDLLNKHQWKQGHESGGNVHWTRPGKTGGTSATVKDNLFYVFTSSDSKFEGGRAYNAFQTYARLEHDGDESAAAVAIVRRRPRTVARATVEQPDEVEVDDMQPGTAKEQPPVELRTPKELWNFNTADDSKCLLGRRFLCEQGSMLLVGESGIGKSSLAMQCVTCWSLGLDVFGIRPKRRLKSLIFQAENDDGDLAEELQGIVRGLQLEHRLDELQDNIAIVSESARTGTNFTAFVREMVRIHKPDLVWIDNLLSYLGGDVSDQKTVSVFLRNQLNPIAKETGCAFVVIHHTGKPPKDTQGKPTGNQYAYLGTGSSDVTNWARAILVLRESEAGIYELRAAKRGARSGLFEGKTSTIPGRSAFIAHGEAGIYWRWSDVIPGQSEIDAREQESAAVLEAIGESGCSWTECLEHVMRTLKLKRTAGAEFFRKHVEKRLDYSPFTKRYSVKKVVREVVRS